MRETVIAQMTRARPARPRTTIALAVDVGAAASSGEKAPEEFRIFKAGENKSEKGDFLFDAEAAESVMREFKAHGKPMLLDFNHGTTFAHPTPEQAISAGRFIPEVRDGELWATQIRWTERASQMIEAKEYLLFSPCFEHDPATGRILRLVNVALTNLPALDQIEALVAASAAANTGGAMNFEQMYTELKARFDALETETKTLRAKLSAYEEKEPDKAAAVTLRASVLSMVGKATDSEALGTLQALKASHERLTQLNAELETQKQTRLGQEFSQLLDLASEKGRIPPAGRPMWEGWAKEDGLEKTTARLRAFLEHAPEKTFTTASAPAPSASGKVHVSEIRRAIAKLDNTPIEQIEKWEAEQAARGAR